MYVFAEASVMMFSVKAHMFAEPLLYTVTSSWPLIKDPSFFLIAWNLQASVGREVSDWGCRSGMTLQIWYQSFTLLSRAKILSWVTCPVKVLLPGVAPLSLLCFAHRWLATCHPDHSEEPSPHNHSSCWIIQSKQWPTFEVGNKLKWRPGVESGSEADAGRRSEKGGALTEGFRYWFV